MLYNCVTLSQQPELEAEMPRLHSENWPEFVLNDPIAIRYRGSLFSTFPDFQYVLRDEQGSALAAGHTIPFVWDGTVEGLPSGWDAVLEQGFHDYEECRLPTAPLSMAITETVERWEEWTGMSFPESGSYTRRAQPYCD